MTATRASGTNAVITNSLFEKNMVTSDHNNFGGAIYLHYDWFGGLYKTLRIENSRITKNIVKSNSSNNSGGQVSGGGIYAGSPFIMMNSIVDSNSATLLTQGGAGTGGGILININNTNDFNGNEVQGSHLLVNNTIVNNIADGEFGGIGGGVHVENSGGSGTWFNNIIYGNTLGQLGSNSGSNSFLVDGSNIDFFGDQTWENTIQTRL